MSLSVGCWRKTESRPVSAAWTKTTSRGNNKMYNHLKLCAAAQKLHAAELLSAAAADAANHGGEDGH